MPFGRYGKKNEKGYVKRLLQSASNKSNQSSEEATPKIEQGSGKLLPVADKARVKTKNKTARLICEPLTLSHFVNDGKNKPYQKRNGHEKPQKRGK